MTDLAMSNRPHFGLAGRVIVITGGGQGIGAACAERFAAEGAQVALWDVNQAAAQALAQRLRDAGAQAEALPCNVTRKGEVQAALAATVLAFGRIDALVNNAGIFRAADFLEVTEEDWDAVIDVNLKGAFLVGQAVAQQMVRQGHGGAIVNMSSVNGSMAIASIASYNASKGAINQLTRAMALALADHQIRVNAAAPGTIATELAREAVLTSDEARQRILGRTPMKRLGEPDEVADVVGFLLSDAARYMTGEIVHVDGGRMALNYTVKV
jgi:3-oxoacyl-[acyl-carrier protein] reductase